MADEARVAGAEEEAAPLSRVYVLLDAAGAVKIGMSVRPSARVSPCRGQRKQPWAMLVWQGARRADASKLEALAKRRFAGRCIEGEWFDIAPSTAIRAIQSIARDLDGGIPYRTLYRKFGERGSPQAVKRRQKQ